MWFLAVFPCEEKVEEHTQEEEKIPDEKQTLEALPG